MPINETTSNIISLFLNIYIDIELIHLYRINYNSKYIRKQCRYYNIYNYICTAAIS